MDIDQDLTLRQVEERLSKAGKKLRVCFEHGVYHAYVHGDVRVEAYDRGDLVEAVSGALGQF
jgi:hypothetical protein